MRAALRERLPVRCIRARVSRRRHAGSRSGGVRRRALPALSPRTFAPAAPKAFPGYGVWSAATSDFLARSSGSDRARAENSDGKETDLAGPPRSEDCSRARADGPRSAEIFCYLAEFLPSRRRGLLAFCAFRSAEGTRPRRGCSSGDVLRRCRGGSARTPGACRPAAAGSGRPAPRRGALLAGRGDRIRRARGRVSWPRGRCRHPRTSVTRLVGSLSSSGVSTTGRSATPPLSSSAFAPGGRARARDRRRAGQSSSRSRTSIRPREHPATADASSPLRAAREKRRFESGAARPRVAELAVPGARRHSATPTTTAAGGPYRGPETGSPFRRAPREGAGVARSALTAPLETGRGCTPRASSDDKAP